MSRGPAIPLTLACLAFTCCTAPAYTESQYRSKVADTAEEAVSAIETTRLALDSALTHHLPSNPIDVAVADQEDLIGSVAGAFASVQPPTADMIELRDQVLALLDEAQGHVEDARIAYRRGESDLVEKSIDAASAVSDKLDRIASRY